MNEQDQPATKADVSALRAEVSEVEAHLVEHMRQIETSLRAEVSEVEAHLVEHMRQIETSLLTAFRSYAQGVNIRFRKLEADAANLDASTLARVDAVEQRVLALEMRLPPSAGRQ
jgi:hypothetical protein